jgi:hypothetical protein
LTCLLATSVVGAAPVAERARAFLEGYNQTYQALYTVSAEATWKSMTDVKLEHTGQRIGAEEARAAFVGKPLRHQHGA